MCTHTDTHTHTHCVGMALSTRVKSGNPTGLAWFQAERNEVTIDAFNCCSSKTDHKISRTSTHAHTYAHTHTRNSEDKGNKKKGRDVLSDGFGLTSCINYYEMDTRHRNIKMCTLYEVQSLSLKPHLSLPHSTDLVVELKQLLVVKLNKDIFLHLQTKETNKPFFG